MGVYCSAFALTIFFIIFAEYWYKKCASCKYANLTCSDMRFKFEKAFVSADYLADKKAYLQYKTKYLIYTVLAILPLFFIAAVRFDVGTDYFYTYVPEFNNSLQGAMPYSEWGFNVLIKIIQLFTTNPQWLFVVTSLIYVSLLINTIVKYSKDAAISVIVVIISCFYFISLNNVRQSIATLFVFAAFPYLVDRKTIPYLAYIAMAYMFHVSAIIMVVPYVVLHFKFIKKYFNFLVVLLFALMPLLCKLAEVVLMNTKYGYYFDSQYDNGEINWQFFFVQFFAFAFAMYCSRNIDKNDNQAFVLIFMQFLSFLACSVNLFINIPEMTTRLTLYFSYYQILLVPYLVVKQKTLKDKLITFIGFLIILGFYLIFAIVLSNHHEVLPYKWIFNYCLQ